MDHDPITPSFERILIVKPSSLGDVVAALPVLRGLRARFPKAKIDWLIAPPFAALLEGHPDLDELVLFDRKRFGRIGRSFPVTAAFFRFLKDLKSRHYDLVIDLQGLFRSAFLTWSTRARVRVGLAEAREGARMFYTHRLSPVDADTHAVDRYRRVGTLLGFDDETACFNLHVTDGDRTAARALLTESGLSESRRFITVVPGTRWETKRWLPERFAQTIDQLQQGDGFRCVLVGGREEAELCETIVRQCDSPPINLAGQTTIRQLVALLEESACVVCQDSAAMHLAVALGRPLVCLIGPTNPARTGPYQRPEDVLRRDLSCAPCYLRKLTQCTHDHRCMAELTVPTVVAAIRRAVETRVPVKSRILL